MIKTSIIIPSLNHLSDCLKPCLESIIKYTDLSENEVIVVANGCTDGTIDYVNSLSLDYSNIKIVVDVKPLGYTVATNRGLEATKGEYIVFLNNDTVLLDQPKNMWLDMLIKPLQDKNVGVSGPLILREGTVNYSFVVFFCAATKRGIINEIGILDEQFSPGGCEDIDFCIRVQQKGYTLSIVPNNNLVLDNMHHVGGFPIFHKAEATVHDMSNWNDIFNNNIQKLIKKYDFR